MKSKTSRESYDTLEVTESIDSMSAEFEVTEGGQNELVEDVIDQYHGRIDGANATIDLEALEDEGYIYDGEPQSAYRFLIKRLRKLIEWM